MPSMRVLIADDHDIVRKGIRALIEEQSGWMVVAEASDGRSAVEKAHESKPDLVILDIGMPILNGLEATRQISKALPKTKILILTMHDSDPLIRQLLGAGARGYVLKSDVGRELIVAMESLRVNKAFFTPKVAQMISDGYLKDGAESEGDHDRDALRLTGRQREIVQLLAEGKSSKEVATQLGISVKTAETHRANIMRRLNCHTVTELVRYAIRNSIIQP